MDETRKKSLLRGPQMSIWGLGLGSSIIGLEIIFLWVSMLLPGTSCAQGHYSYYEIVIPRKLGTFKNREESLEKLSYVLLIKGKRQVIRLRLKRGLFTKDFPVYTYTKDTLDLDIPFVQDDCYYDGYVEGEQQSLVSISTCSGLKGMISIEKSVYGIEPIGTSKNFEHVLYHVDGHVRGSCKVNGKDTPTSTPHLQPRRDEDSSHWEAEPVRFLNYIWSHPKYVEMFVVVDNRRFHMWNGNVTKTVQMVMDALAHVNTYSQAIRVKVVLIGLEIWTERDQVRIPEDLREVLHNFNHWRERELLSRAKHDVAHLIVGHHPGEYLGEAFLNGACVSGLAAGVESFYHEDPPLFAVLMVHELGHNLGMKHDHVACICPDQPSCIMLGTVSLESRFSNCSLEAFYEFLRHQQGSCLYDKPAAAGVARGPFCGDHVVDRGEECDCGSVGDCMKDRCCLPSCRLRRGSACASGPCCSKCKFLKAATPCRPSVDECDLPEYCNGSSPWCQPDTYKQDGSPCRGGGYCYQGRCRSLESQCVQVFGEGSRAARQSCYHHLNTQGDRFGNCGSGQEGLRKAFVKCAPEHVMCGRLLCEGIARLPLMRNHHTLIQIPLEDTWCWGVDLFEDVDLPDGGAVKAGTLCGPQKICLNRTCSDVQVLQYDCEPETRCHGRGVCNNLKHCHCDDGYAPPTCASEGFGGSVDSGPPPQDTVAALEVRARFPAKNPPPTQAAHFNVPPAITPRVMSDIYDEASQAPLLSFGPTIQAGSPESSDCSSKKGYKKIPAVVVLISALIVNILLLMSLLSIVFVLFFYQNIPWSAGDEKECAEICEARERVNPPPP
ncbi:disintegrin and metalloproteinase domain-containing protein 1a-like [Dromiciops gliroides]|uniref:disintegrin and metalloproteinase domain-containing protein 1a-like n=1 Tax=Dromiciops gliroides TaxID=33562 RepID=UPI001CC46ECA|nr:disintegrin and metalloproteinase domain-containing protein 1a-like [Dromiciops gliroides]